MRHLFDGIAVPQRNLNEDISASVGNALAAQAGFDVETRRGLQLIEFVVCRLVARLKPLTHNHMARRTGDDPAAGVFERNIEALANIQDRTRQSAALVGDVVGVNRECMRFPFVQNGDFIRFRGFFYFGYVQIRVDSGHFRFNAPVLQVCGLTVTMFPSASYRRTRNTVRPALVLLCIENSPMKISPDILATIGRTPLVALSRVANGCAATILGKVEMTNPGGSIKDRIALAMVEDAERRGTLRPGATIVEATAGNTGVGLAMVAAVRGYKCVFVMPQKMSRDKEELLRAYGAEVLRVPNASPDSPDNFQNVARRLSQEKGYFLPDQFANGANPDVHFRTTAPEIWHDTGGTVDAFVCGVGTGGTLSGVGRYLKQQKPSVEIVLADPVGSTFSGGAAGSYLLEGIGGSAIPGNFDPTLVSYAVTVTDKDSFLMTRRLAREEGILAGGAAGCAVWAAIEYGNRPENAGQTIVVLLPDTGRNYLSKIFNDDWMREQGFLPVMEGTQ